jgi:hypothetical protein
MIEDLGLNHIVLLLGADFADRLLSDPMRRSDLCGYIDYLLASATSQSQKGLLGRLKTKTEASECPTFGMWLALVYAIRNMYVHNTDTAKSGVKSYATKIVLLQISKDFMIGSMLAISEHLFSAETSLCQ